MLECVRDDIGEQLAQPILIAFHPDIGIHVQHDVVRVPGVRDLQRLDRLVEEIMQAETFDVQARRARLHARQIEQERYQVG